MVVEVTIPKADNTTCHLTLLADVALGVTDAVTACAGDGVLANVTQFQQKTRQHHSTKCLRGVSSKRKAVTHHRNILSRLISMQNSMQECHKCSVLSNKVTLR